VCGVDLEAEEPRESEAFVHVFLNLEIVNLSKERYWRAINVY